MNLVGDNDPKLEGSLLSIEVLRQLAGWYLAGTEVEDDRVRSMIHPLETDLGGLPPLLIQCGSGEPIFRDVQRLADHATACGVDTRLDVYPADTHNFQLFWSFLPEAADAVRELGNFLASATSEEVVGLTS